MGIRRWLEIRYVANIGDVVVLVAHIIRLAALLFLGYVAWAQLVGNVWPPSWLILTRIKDQWGWFIIVLFATAFVAFNVPAIIEKLKPSGSAEQIGNYIEMAAHDMRHGLKTLAENKFNRAVEQLLIAMQFDVEKTLGLTSRNLIQVNLIWVAEDGEHRKIEVAARSKPGICPVFYEWDAGRLSCRAIDQNQTVVQCNVRSLPGFERKPYNCVVAVPIVCRDKCFGAITVDSKDGKTFAGREALLDRLLRPYGALLLLTRVKDAPYHECPQRDVR